MSLPKPELDNRTFDQLVGEVRKLIPGYSSEWTDYNLSDPGITFIDLFAWLTEIALYRTNLVTDKHRLKYLKLLGVKPQPSKPAKVDLTFSSVEKTLSKGTQVSTEVDSKKVYFQLDEDISIVPAELEKIVVDEFTSGIYDRSSSNENGDLFFAPFGESVQRGCALYLGFNFKNNKAPKNLSFMCYLYEKDLKEPGKHGDEQDYKFGNSSLKWDIWASRDEKKDWVPIKLTMDKTEGFKRSGRITFEGFEDWKAPSETPELLNNLGSHFWLRCRVEDSCYYEYPPRIESLRINTFSATHGLTVSNDNENRISNGLPYQVFKLTRTPVLDKTLELSIEGEKWTEVDDFEGSGPSDKHFILDKEKGEIKFGDGLMGLIPSEGSAIELKYISGGGEEGNLKAGCRWEIEGFNGLIINPFASVGGKQAQTIDETIEDFRRDLRVPYTAVTLDDFEYIAVNTPGLRVAKAKAIPNYNPENPNPKDPEDSKGSVTVVIIPYTPLEIFETPPEPSQEFKHAVCLHLDKHRLIGTDIHVISPIYTKVSVNATIVPVNSFRDDTQIMKNVFEKLNFFLHPIKGGDDGKGWPIGRDVYLSDLYKIIESSEGVNCVIRLSISGDQDAFTDTDGNLILNSKFASIYSGVHRVEIVRETDKCRKRGDSYSGS